MTPPPHHHRDLTDTGESRAVSEAMREAREVFVTEVECMANARQVVREEHDLMCPAKDMKASIKSVEDAIGEVKTQFAEFQGVFTAKMNNLEKQVDRWFTRGVVVVGLIFTIVGGVWAVSSVVHSGVKHSSIESRDAGLPAGTAVAYSSNK